MLASSFGDPVIGVDVHIELVPMPAPVPTPIPNPFTGVVFDPMGLVVGLAISNVIGAVMGAPPQGPVLYWGAFPATNTGTEAKHVPGHIIIPPGTAWAPFPKAPKPVIHAGEAPKPPNPVKPEDDAICVFGSKTVSVMGSNAVRLGDILLSCSEPVRLPSSVVMAVPKGAPIIIGGPPSLDLMAAVFASLRTRFMSDAVHSLISRMKPSRLRNFMHKAACFLTGHPVDVASGKMVTSAVDSDLRGPLPLRIERTYSSAFASRRGALGHGWSLSLDQSIWREPGKVVYLAEDGREIEFDTFDLPGHQPRPGQNVWHPIARLMLRCVDHGRWEIESNDGTVREFGPIPGIAGADRAVIRRIRSRSGFHEIVFEYDEEGRLERVRDSGGRLIRLEYDDQNRLVALKLPVPHGRGWYVHRRYEYDHEGDLIRVTDSEGASWTFEYTTHLMTRETDRTGLSFHFAYDGFGEDAWCIRTWGAGGIYDHVLSYDKKNHVTYVTNSLGHTTQYKMNLAGLVTSVIDPLQGQTSYEYDPVCFEPITEVDLSGARSEYRYDSRGCVVEVVRSGQGPTRIEYDDVHHLPTSMRTAAGAVLTWRYDEHGQLVERIGLGGAHTGIEWQNGLIRRMYHAGGTDVRLFYDAQKALQRVVHSSGAEEVFVNDQLGRSIRRRTARGGKVDIMADTENRVLAVRTPAGHTRRMEYDAEGNVVHILDPLQEIHLRYGHYHRLVERSEQGTSVHFDYDNEDQLLAVTNERGERQSFGYDEAGRVVDETGFDGGLRHYDRDRGGRMVRRVLPSGRECRFTYTEAGRIASIVRSDGTADQFEYGPAGELVRASNGVSDILLEHDEQGNLLRESGDGGTTWVSSMRAAGGARILLESTLGARQHIVRDALGRVAELRHGGLSDTDGGRIKFERDPLGEELARHIPGGLRIVTARDEAGRPMGRQTIRVGHTSTEVVEAKRFEWQGETQLTGIREWPRDDTAYEYDAQARLVGEHRGSRYSRRAFALGAPVRYPTDRVGPGGRLEEAGGARCDYDEDGNIVRKIEADGGEWTYEWNAAGMLVGVTGPDALSVQYEYDALGRRSRKVVVKPARAGQPAMRSEHRFVWDGHTLLHELSSEEGLTTWYWEPGCFIPIVKERGNRRWSILSDRNGSPGEMYDENGELTFRMHLDLFGAAQIERGAPTDCRWRFPGQYDDVETRQYYTRWRYYDPAMGTFTSKDPLGLNAGHQLYGYPPDPVRQMDPLGLFFGTTTQVPYWTNDFQPELDAMHGPPNGPAPHPLGHTPIGNTMQNVAIVELADGTRIPFHSGIDGHSEQAMIRCLTDSGIQPSQVRRIYSELTPCLDRCLPALREWLGDNARNVALEFSFHHLGSDDLRWRLKRERRQQVCG